MGLTGLSVRAFVDDPRGFADAAEGWLLEREAEQGLLLGIVDQLRRGDHGYDHPLYLAVVLQGGAVVGCAWRTPPMKVGLTDMPAGAGALVAADVADHFASIPEVMGPPGAAGAFAEAWCRLRDVGAVVGERHRLHVLEAVRWPARPAPGALRWAGEDDRDRVEAWHRAFVAETGVAAGPPGAPTGWVEGRRAALWDDGGTPRSLAVVVGTTPRGVRIGAVYTPPEERGRGYATTAVATLSRWMLERGSAFCTLYTQAGNATSNAIYGAIGYVPVADVTNVGFVAH